VASDVIHVLGNLAVGALDDSKVGLLGDEQTEKLTSRTL